MTFFVWVILSINIFIHPMIHLIIRIYGNNVYELRDLYLNCSYDHPDPLTNLDDNSQ